MNTLNAWYTRKGFVHGPLGFAMKPDAAQELEPLLKEAGANGLEYQRRFIVADEMDVETKGEADADKIKHTVLLTASTNDVDRDNEIVLQKGIDLSMFRKNPVMAWAHDTSSRPPLGYFLWSKIVDDKLKGFAKFADRPADYPPGTWEAETIYHLVAQGVVKGVSIGFLPLDARAPNEKEITANPKWAAAKRIITKSMLLEISLVPIGCNQNALVETVGKGLVSETEAKGFGFELPHAVFQDWDWITEDVVVKRPNPRLEILKRFTT